MLWGNTLLRSKDNSSAAEHRSSEASRAASHALAKFTHGVAETTAYVGSRTLSEAKSSLAKSAIFDCSRCSLSLKSELQGQEPEHTGGVPTLTFSRCRSMNERLP